jgi:hypothetical protein
MKYDRENIIRTTNALIQKMNACGDWQMIDDVVYAITNREEMRLDNCEREPEEGDTP